MKPSSFHHKLIMVAATAAAALLSSPAAVQAETVYGLTTGGSLFSFNSATPGTTTAQVAITGVTTGQVLVGMDFRPSTGELFALSYATGSGASQLYTLNRTTGAATAVGTGFTLQAGIGSSRFGFDFNPAVDRIRAIGGQTGTAATNGANYRLNPITGAIAATDINVAFDPADVNTGITPLLAGLAYSNNFGGTAMTTLYGYDYATDSIVTVGNVNGTPVSPNAGTLFTLGGISGNTGVVSNTASLDMDISGATGIAYLNLDTTSANDNLYTINLTSGLLTNVGLIGAGITVLDIAVQPIPEPGTYALLVGAFGVLLLARRWRSTRSRADVAA